MMKKNIETAVKYLIYATFFVPILVIPSAYIFPFIVPKIIWFRSLVEIMLGAYALLLIINWNEYKPKLTALNVVLFLFLLSFAISTFTGADPYHSFWDNHERMLGLFTIFHYVAYYFIASAVFKDWTNWQWALRVFLLAGSVVMFIGLLQVQNPNLLVNQGNVRVASTLGNPIYVGGYGLFLTFVAYLLAVREKNKFLLWTECLLGVLAFLGMFYSGTRGSMLGLVAGVGVAMVGYIIVLKNQPRVRLILGGITALLLVLISLLYAFRQTSFVSNIPAVGRAINTTVSDIKSSARWIAWEIAIKSWQDKPVFGWGPNNFYYAFNAHYNPRSMNFGYGETWFDNAHNIILNTLAVQGLFGLIVYLAIFVICISTLFRAWHKNNLNMHLVIVGSAFVVAHLLQNVTVFENPTSYLYFMFWLAMINALSAKKVDLDPKQLNLNNNVRKPDKNIGYGYVGTAAVFCLLLVFIFNIQPARANKMTLTAIREISTDPALGIIPMKEALEFSSPHIDDIRNDIGRTVTQILVPNNFQKIGKDRVKEIFDLTYTNLQKNLLLHPLDVRSYLTLAQLGQIGTYMNDGKNYTQDMISYLEKSLILSPRRQQIIYMLSTMYINTGQAQKAVPLLESSLKDNSTIPDTYWRLAYAYEVAGETSKLADILNLIKTNKIEFDEQGQGIMQSLMSVTPGKK